MSARPATRLIGREEQVAALHRLLATERLVTLVGAGGVGKTRVALEVAHPPDRRRCCCSHRSPTRPPFRTRWPRRWTSPSCQGDVLAACLAVLGERPGLLVIDNCEHLLDAARDTVGVVLAACPRLSVLATSREPLGLAAEYAFRLAPLPLPGRRRRGR